MKKTIWHRRLCLCLIAALFLILFIALFFKYNDIIPRTFFVERSNKECACLTEEKNVDFLCATALTVNENEQESVDESVEEGISDVIDELLNGLDLDSLDGFVSNYGGSFFEGGIKQTLADIACGKFSLDYNGFFSLIGSIFGAKIKELSPMCISVFAIAVFYGIVAALNKNSRVSGIVFNVCYCASVGVIFCEVFALVKSILSETTALCSAADAVFPLLLTLLSLSGGGASVEIFKPACVFVGGAGLNLAVKVLVPFAVSVTAISGVSSFSAKFSLKKISAFLESAFKWIIGIVLIFFSIFTAIGGVSAAGYDGAGLKILKFALSGGLPFVGGLAGGGVDLIVLSAGLIKNSVGIAVVVCLLFSLLSSALKIACFSLCLKLISALSEPIADGRFCDAVSAFCKSLSMFTAILFYVFVLYFTVIAVLLTAQSALFS